MSVLRESLCTSKRLDVFSPALHGVRLSTKAVCACVVINLLYFLGCGVEGKVSCILDFSSGRLFPAQCPLALLQSSVLV